MFCLLFARCLLLTTLPKKKTVAACWLADSDSDSESESGSGLFSRWLVGPYLVN